MSKLQQQWREEEKNKTKQNLQTDNNKSTKRLQMNQAISLKFTGRRWFIDLARVWDQCSELAIIIFICAASATLISFFPSFFGPSLLLCARCSSTHRTELMKCNWWCLNWNLMKITCALFTYNRIAYSRHKWRWCSKKDNVFACSFEFVAFGPFECHFYMVCLWLFASHSASMRIDLDSFKHYITSRGWRQTFP